VGKGRKGKDEFARMGGVEARFLRDRVGERGGTIPSLRGQKATSGSFYSKRYAGGARIYTFVTFTKGGKKNMESRELRRWGAVEWGGLGWSSYGFAEDARTHIKGGKKNLRNR